jgi:hypothetical protein
MSHQLGPHRKIRLGPGPVQALKGSSLSVWVFRAVTPDAASDNVLKLAAKLI